MLQCRHFIFVMFFTAVRKLVVVEPFTTLQYDITTMATNGSYNDTECYCDCEELEAAQNRSGTAPSTQHEAEQAASKLQEELRVDKTNLSSTLRRKTSAPDHRPSAQGLGVVGIIVIVTVLLSIVVLDLNVLYQDLRVAVCRVLGLELPEGWHLARRSTSFTRRGRGYGGRGLRAMGGGSGEGRRNSGGGGGRGGGRSSGQDPVYAPFHPQDDGKVEGRKDKQNGAQGVGNMASTPLPVRASGVPDIKSRRELLLMHGELR